jgi:hypothetical protein
VDTVRREAVLTAKEHGILVRGGEHLVRTVPHRSHSRRRHVQIADDQDRHVVEALHDSAKPGDGPSLTKVVESGSAQNRDRKSAFEHQHQAVESRGDIVCVP